MNEFYEGRESCDYDSDSLQSNDIETTEIDELQEEKSDDPICWESEFSESDIEVSNLEHQYEQAKLSIELSRTQEEQEYWIKRSEELWNERDIATSKYLNYNN